MNYLDQILDKFVKVKPGTSSCRWYRDKGYNFKLGEIIEVKLEDLTELSSAIVNIKCFNCDNILSKAFYDVKYALNKRDNNYYCGKCSSINRKITNLEKYGNECSLLNDKIKEKSRETMIKIYGVENISSYDENKIQKSERMKIHEKDNFKNRCLNKYGIENASSLDWVKEKRIQTNLERWGVENPTQNPELFNKSQKSGKHIKIYEGISYRGTYELDFIKYCLSKNITVEKGPTIKYIFNNKKSYYHSDFYLPEYNLICEIKSNYYYQRFLEKNKLKKEFSIKSGYNFFFVIDKEYDELSKMIK